MRPARATRARAPGTATEPEAVRVGRAGPEAGRTSVTTRPSSRKPLGSRGNTRCLPKRSSRVTAPASQRITAPQKPVPGSSTTRPGSAGTCGTGLGFFHGGVRSGEYWRIRMTIGEAVVPSVHRLPRHAETRCQGVPLGPYERGVHHRAVAGYVQRVLAAEGEDAVEGRRPVRRYGVGARLGFARLLDQVAAEDDRRIAVAGYDDYQV